MSISGIGSYFGGKAAEKGARGAAAAQTGAAEREIDLLERMYQDSLKRTAPYETAGRNAMGVLAGLALGQSNPLVASGRMAGNVAPVQYGGIKQSMEYDPAEQYEQFKRLTSKTAVTPEMAAFLRDFVGIDSTVGGKFSDKGLSAFRPRVEAARDKILNPQASLNQPTYNGVKLSTNYNPQEMYNQFQNMTTATKNTPEMAAFLRDFVGIDSTVGGTFSSKGLAEFKPRVAAIKAQAFAQPITAQTQQPAAPIVNQPVNSQTGSNPMGALEGQYQSSQPIAQQPVASQPTAPLGTPTALPPYDIATGALVQPTATPPAAQGLPPATSQYSATTPSAIPQTGAAYGNPINVQNQFTPFFASPDYNIRYQQGLEALQRAANAQGRSYSGAQLKAITQYGQDMASQEYANYYNRLANLAGMGQVQATNTANQNMNYGANQGQNYQNLGMAQGSGMVALGNLRAQRYQGVANSIQSAANSFMGGFNGGMGGMGF